MGNLITEGNYHVFVCGLTQSGKSFFAKRAILEMSEPAVYFNPQGETVPSGFVTVYTDRCDVEQLIDLLHDGCKVNLVFGNTRKGYDYVAGYVLNALMDAGFDDQRPIYVAVDECHLLHGYSLEIARYVSTAGLKKGVRVVWITQRPALCDKTLYTQAFAHYIFYITEADRAYMIGKGIDYESCRLLWGDPHSHKYVYFDGYETTGRPAL